ncbi:hypothetical protein [Flavobacterium adhaerens]|uniref:hypothetical protein n=1 Tax=Flavobacterium adhaerens TaxID=3149043 RepID=UPI0032B32202
MKPTYHYTTVLEALTDLKKNGFSHDFNQHHELIITNPENYSIVHIYRYEGDSDPDEEAIVYGIKSISGDNGVFVSGFSANSSSKAAVFLENLSLKNHD